MTPEEKKLIVQILIDNEWSNPYLQKTEIGLAEKLKEEWQDDIFICPSCAKCVTWDDSVKAAGDIAEGKAGSPSEIICKGCANVS